MGGEGIVVCTLLGGRKVLVVVVGESDHGTGRRVARHLLRLAQQGRQATRADEGRRRAKQHDLTGEGHMEGGEQGRRSEKIPSHRMKGGVVGLQGADEKAGDGPASVLRTCHAFGPHRLFLTPSPLPIPPTWLSAPNNLPSPSRTPR